MFSSAFSPSPATGIRFSAVIASVSSALAYMIELDDAAIDVSQSGSGLVLGGTAPTPEIREIALQLARDLSGCPVRDHIAITPVN